MKKAHFALGAMVVCAAFAARALTGAPAPSKSASSSPNAARISARRDASPAAPPAVAPRIGRNVTVTAVEPTPELDKLRTGLESPRVAERIAAIETVREQGLTAALPDLESVAIEQDPWVGRAAIDAIGAIAKVATAAEAEVAAERLGSWLDSEQRRVDADPAAPGNLVQLVEALGQVPAPAASTALRRLLSDGELPRYLQVLTARQLEAAADPAAVRELRDFKARASSWVATDNGEREEAAQALAVADAALAAARR